jgi:thioredoxin-related protein
VTYIERWPVETRFNLIQMFTVREMAQVFRDKYVERFIDLIVEGRQELEDPESMSGDVAVSIFGSICESLVKFFHNGSDVGDLQGHIPELMYLAVCPYVGHEKAREELTIDSPVPG